MHNTLKLLAIDDNKLSQRFIIEALGNEYALEIASDGKEGLSKVETNKPDIILLDVEMPGMNGYEVCDALKHNPETHHIPVVFLSSLSSLRERMQGFEVGGDDYVVKPFEPEALKAKLGVLIRYRDQNRQLEVQVNEAKKTAFTAMTGSSELGQAMSLVEKSYAINSLDMLANHIFQFTESLDLNCSLYMNNQGTPSYFSQKGTVSPLEQDLLLMLKGKNRFTDFGCRTYIDYTNISMLIKNMPLGDMERYGRIKDLLPPILGAFDAKIKMINIEQGIREQSINLNQSFQLIKDTISDLGSSLRINARNGHETIKNMLKDLENHLPGMALEEDQEGFILDRLDEAVKSTSNITDTSENISVSFQMVISELQTLVDQQNALVEQSVKQFAQQYTELDNTSSMDIELF